MSSITEQDIEEKAIKAGATGFMRKPFKINELKDRVLQLLN
jgi:FixJ family two-component response regulator